MQHASWALAPFIASCFAAMMSLTIPARGDEPPTNSAVDSFDPSHIAEPPPQNASVSQQIYPRLVPPMLRPNGAQAPPQSSADIPAVAPTPIVTPEITWGEDRPAEVAEFIYPSPSCTATESVDSAIAVTPAPAVCDVANDSTLYFRADSYDWTQQTNGRDYDEFGALYTLGYAYRLNQQRIRAEIFGGRATHTDDFFTGVTDTIGFRLEYERIYDPEMLPRLSCFYGIGTRFWVRDRPDTLANYGGFVDGFQQTWWTLYPYIGFETRHNPQKKYEFYFMSRIGIDAISWEHDVSFHRHTLDFYPSLGLTSQVEVGIRGKYVRNSLFLEVMDWGRSPSVDGWYYPASDFTTLGLKTTISF